MNRRILAVLVATVLAIAAASLVLVYVSGADQRAIAAQQPTDVWMATKDIPTGTTLKDAERTELVEVTQVPAAAVPRGAVTDIGADNDQLLALSEITAGEILIGKRFGTQPRGTKAIEVPSGMLAVAVELSDPARVGDLITPGSRITIYRNTKMVALDDSPRSEKINEFDFQRTEVLIGDVQVIAMGDAVLSAPQADRQRDSEEDSSSSASFLVTVAVTPEQSLRLVHTAMNGQMYAALRGSDVDVDHETSVNDLEWPGGMP